MNEILYYVLDLFVCFQERDIKTFTNSIDPSKIDIKAHHGKPPNVVFTFQPTVAVFAEFTKGA